MGAVIPPRLGVRAGGKQKHSPTLTRFTPGLQAGILSLHQDAGPSVMVLRASQQTEGMSGDPSDEELEKLRQEKMEQLKEQQGGADEEAMEQQRQQAEAQKKAVLRQNLTDGARKRLNTVKMSKPDVGEQVEQQIVALAQSGRIQGKIDEEKMKQLLQELTPDSKSFDIQRR
jgi:programmed cell death protein 5